ncbi:MAG: hypothetical protein OEL83_16615 [Desulforhopalus sp.]|nr:hypothetical protein [Desulforhopalus sp.]
MATAIFSNSYPIFPTVHLEQGLCCPVGQAEMSLKNLAFSESSWSGTMAVYQITV